MGERASANSTAINVYLLLQLVVADRGGGETSVRQVAKDFGISETCLARWLRLADRDVARSEE
jgi:transposase-like protein